MRTLSDEGSLHHSIVVSSASRNLAQYPTPQQYQIQLRSPLQKVGVVYLAMINFVSPGGLAAVLQLAEFHGHGLSQSSAPNGGDTIVAAVPLPLAGQMVLRSTVDMVEGDSIRCRDVQRYVDTNTLTVSWLDENGNPLAAMPEHVMRLVFVKVSLF